MFQEPPITEQLHCVKKEPSDQDNASDTNLPIAAVNKHKASAIGKQQQAKSAAKLFAEAAKFATAVDKEQAAAAVKQQQQQTEQSTAIRHISVLQSQGDDVPRRGKQIADIAHFDVEDKIKQESSYIVIF